MIPAMKWAREQFESNYYRIEICCKTRMRTKPRKFESNYYRIEIWVELSAG